MLSILFYCYKHSDLGVCCALQSRTHLLMQSRMLPAAHVSSPLIKELTALMLHYYIPSWLWLSSSCGFRRVGGGIRR